VAANEEKQERERQAALNQALRREVNERRTQGGEDAEVVRLVVRPGHVHHESERVLMEEPGRFLVVEKFGPAGEVVAHLDPRGPTRRRSRG
jgi:hypothetical protein